MLRNEKPNSDAPYAIRRAIAAVYAELGLELLTAAWSNDRATFTLRDVLKSVQPADAVISFNWDVLIETLLTKREFMDLKLFQAPATLDSRGVRFAKPLGSLSWRRRIGGLQDRRGRQKEELFEWSKDGGPLLDPMRYGEIKHEHGVSHEPLMLGAVPIKSELIREIQHTHKYDCSFVFDRIVDQWQTLCRALQDADELYVVGYSFPSEDAYGGFLLREAARSRVGRPLTVQIYETEPNRMAVESRIVQIVGASPAQIAWRGPVESSFREQDA